MARVELASIAAAPQCLRGEKTLTSSTCRLAPGYLIAALTLASLMSAPARADFFDGARRTFTNDIPHFFQDDIPCAFGGQPTSHTRSSCKSSAPSAKPAADGDHSGTKIPADNPNAIWDKPPNSGR
jgi:hypothetical protein